MNVSKRLKKGQLQTQIGTPYYMSPEIWQNRPYDSSSDIWALGCMIYELCSLRPPFLGNSFPELKRAISTGRYTPLPRKYTEALHNVVRVMLKLNPRERPSADEMLRSADVIRKLHLDGGSAPIVADQPSFPNMMETIKVPQNLKKLGSALPKPCYPDVRPNSPGAWIVSEQEKISDEPAPAQRPSRAVPPPPPAHIEKENNGMPNYGKVVASVKEDKQAVERRLQALREGAVNRPNDLFSIAENGGAAAIVGPPGQPQYVRAAQPSAAAIAPSSAAYMPHYEGIGGANGAYQRGRYKPSNLVPPPASHRMW
jgi:serine/threonine protein kinase